MEINKYKTILRTTRKKLAVRKIDGKFIYRDHYGNEGLIVFVPGKTKPLRKFARFVDNPHLQAE